MEWAANRQGARNKSDRGRILRILGLYAFLKELRSFESFDTIFIRSVRTWFDHLGRWGTFTSLLVVTYYHQE